MFKKIKADKIYQVALFSEEVIVYYFQFYGESISEVEDQFLKFYEEDIIQKSNVKIQVDYNRKNKTIITSTNVAGGSGSVVYKYEIKPLEVLKRD